MLQHQQERTCRHPLGSGDSSGNLHRWRWASRPNGYPPKIHRPRRTHWDYEPRSVEADYAYSLQVSLNLHQTAYPCIFTLFPVTYARSARPRNLTYAPCEIL